MTNAANAPGLAARLREHIKAEGRTPGIDEVCKRYACSRDHARKVLARLRYEATAGWIGRPAAGTARRPTSRLVRTRWTVKVTHEIWEEPAYLAISGSPGSQPSPSRDALQQWARDEWAALGSLDAPRNIPRGSVKSTPITGRGLYVTHYLEHTETRA